LGPTRRGLAALGVACGLAGCSTDRLTEPTETATEQLLVSTAVDAAVARLTPTITPGTKVFVDAQYVDTAPADAALYTKYAVASVRDRLLHLGARLVDDRKAADMVAELRSGGQSIEHHGFLVGLPSVPVPVPLTGTVTTPKLALFESDRQTGIAKLALTAYDKDGRLAASTGPTYGESRTEDWTVLFFVSWNDQDILPDSAKR
jgi:hypothetical protein